MTVVPLSDCHKFKASLAQQQVSEEKTFRGRIYYLVVECSPGTQEVPGSPSITRRFKSPAQLRYSAARGAVAAPPGKLSELPCLSGRGALFPSEKKMMFRDHSLRGRGLTARH